VCKTQALSGLVILGCFMFVYTVASILSYVDRSVLTLGSLRYYCSSLIHVIGVFECVKAVCYSNKRYSKKETVQQQTLERTTNIDFTID
jgi:hypothetical protein